MERGSKILLSTLLAIAILVPLASITKNGGGGAMRSSGGGGRGLSGGGAGRMSSGGAMRSTSGGHSSGTPSARVSQPSSVSSSAGMGTRVSDSGARRSGPTSGVARPAGTSGVDRRVAGSGARRADSTPAISTRAAGVAEADGARRGDGRRDGTGRRGDRRGRDGRARRGDARRGNRNRGNYAYRHGHGGHNWSNGSWGWWGYNPLWWGLPVAATALWLTWPREQFYEPYDSSQQVINDSNQTIIIYSGGTPEIELAPGENAYMPSGLKLVIRFADDHEQTIDNLDRTYRVQ